MGWETAAIAGFQILGASNTMEAGKANAQAIADQGTQQAKTIADNTLRRAGTLQTSFLQGGIVLDDGPKSVISQAFGQGYTDINRTVTNANNSAANTYNTARTKALSSLASGASSIIGGSDIGGGFGSDWNGLGQTTGSWFDPSPVGPYQSPLSSSSGFWK